MKKEVEQFTQNERLAPLMTNRDIMNFLQVNKKTLSEYRKQGMPFLKLNQRTFRYDTKKIIEWIERNE